MCASRSWLALVGQPPPLMGRLPRQQRLPLPSLLQLHGGEVQHGNTCREVTSCSELASDPILQPSPTSGPRLVNCTTVVARKEMDGLGIRSRLGVCRRQMANLVLSVPSVVASMHADDPCLGFPRKGS